MFAFPRRLVVGDVSFIHTAAVFFARAPAQLPGSAAARRDAAKKRAYRLASSGSLCLCPWSHSGAFVPRR
jgi:hypothetical protein